MIERGTYPYLYETHLHTSLVSACGSNSPEEMVRKCKQYGYAGIFITEHNWGGNVRRCETLSWEEYVDFFSSSYFRAYEEGCKINLQVFFGWEAGYSGTEFLIYGLSPEWLKSHPDIRFADIKEQYQMIHEAGGMVIHAHPFREESYIDEIRLFPEFVDGVEIFNACHSHTKSKSHRGYYQDKLAMEYAHKYQKRCLAGSDIHSTDLFGAGVAFQTPLTDTSDFINRILCTDEYRLTNGEFWTLSDGYTETREFPF